MEVILINRLVLCDSPRLTCLPNLFNYRNFKKKKTKHLAGLDSKEDWLENVSQMAEF